MNNNKTQKMDANCLDCPERYECDDVVKETDTDCNRPKIIAVDFDGTLCENAWPEIGTPNKRLIEALIRRQQKGDKIILWTCRDGQMLFDAVAWCARQDLAFDAINKNLPESIKLFGNDSRKVFANEYIDDLSYRPWMWEFANS